MPAGIWTLADVLDYGKEERICPYFAVRRTVRGYTENFCQLLMLLVADALCRCDHLLFPLFARPQSGRTGVQRNVERFNCCL
jgi:hypothetical protein